MKRARLRKKCTIDNDHGLVTGTASVKSSAITIAAKGHCPVCTQLREFQNYLSKNLRPYECSGFCNLHAWVIANSSPAESVATMFLASVRDPNLRPSLPNPVECTFCKRMHIEKEARIADIAEELNRSNLSEWLDKHGMPCFRHSREMIPKLTELLRRDFENTMSQKVRDLEHELDDFLQKARRGQSDGGGILGRAAEYLVAQRGIES